MVSTIIIEREAETNRNLESRRISDQKVWSCERDEGPRYYNIRPRFSEHCWAVRSKSGLQVSTITEVGNVHSYTSFQPKVGPGDTNGMKGSVRPIGYTGETRDEYVGN